MLLTAATGSENFQSTGQAKNYLFYIPTPDLGGEECFLSQACRHKELTKKGFGLVGKPTVLPAASGFGEEVGRWTMGTYEVPEGALLKLFASRAGGFGSMKVVANQFIRMRSTAALQRITTELTGNPQATFPAVCIEGRFDILTLDEGIEMGAVVPNHFRGGFDESMVRRIFAFQTVEGELAPRPIAKVVTVTNSKNEEVEVRMPSRRRALPF